MTLWFDDGAMAAATSIRLWTGMMALGMMVWLTACDPGGVEQAIRTIEATQLTRSISRDAIHQTTPAAVSDVTNPCHAGGCHGELKQNEQRYKHKPYADERCLDCHKGFHTA